MPRASGNKHGIVAVYSLPVVQVGLAVSHHDKSISVLNAYKLVKMGMHFKPDIPMDRYAHQCHLEMVTRP